MAGPPTAWRRNFRESLEMTSERQQGGGRPEPMLNAPAGIVWAIALLAGIHAGFDLMTESQEEWWKLVLAFIPSRLTAPGPAFPGDLPGAAVWSFVTHQFIHADWAHVGLNCAWLLAFGGAVAARIGMLRFALLGLASGISGAVLFLLLHADEAVPMAGASGAVSGLMGGACRFFFAALDRGGLHAFRDAPGLVPRMSLRQTFADRRIRMLLGIWFVLNFLTAMVAPYLTSSGGGIAWEAHLGGFLFGLFAFALFDPFPQADPTGQDDGERHTLH